MELDSREFDIINLPSKGRFYEGGQSSLMIKYLTGVEEKVLTSHFLNQSGKATELVLNNVIIDEFDPLDLVIPDYQGILMFLYSTAWGDNVNLNLKCNSCGHKTEWPVKLSSLKFKESTVDPVDGTYSFYIPARAQYNNWNITPHVINMGDAQVIEIKIRPLTLRDDLKYKSIEKAEGKSVFRRKLIDSVQSFGGIENTNFIKSVFSAMHLMDFNKARKFFSDTEIGIENNIHFICPVCGHEDTHKFGIGNDFLQLPESHLKNIKEECFLASHYSQNGVSYNEAMNMSISDRKWYLQRLQEEFEKKKKAEDAEVQKAKSRAKSSGR